MALQTAYAAASVSESSINRVCQIVKDAVSAHSFKTQVNRSVAEETIQRYSENTCWGCLEKGHSFAGKRGTITCPNELKPGVTERAAKARKDFNERIRKRKDGGSNNNRTKCGATALLSKAMKGLSGDDLKALLTGSSPAKKGRPTTPQTRGGHLGLARCVRHSHTSGPRWDTNYLFRASCT
jgi:hypothetical protein